MGQAHHETTQVGVYGWKNLSLSQGVKSSESNQCEQQQDAADLFG